MEVKLVDRDMAQFGLGPSKVVPREKIITYLGQTSGYLPSFGLTGNKQARALIYIYCKKDIHVYTRNDLLIFIF